jgi:hypothetical protein
MSYVPDADHKRLIDLCHGDKRMTVVPLTTEEEGTAVAAGAWLGGDQQSVRAELGSALEPGAAMFSSPLTRSRNPTMRWRSAGCLSGMRGGAQTNRHETTVRAASTLVRGIS